MNKLFVEIGTSLAKKWGHVVATRISNSNFSSGINYIEVHIITEKIEKKLIVTEKGSRENSENDFCDVWRKLAVLPKALKKFVQLFTNINFCLPSRGTSSLGGHIGCNNLNSGKTFNQSM